MRTGLKVRLWYNYLSQKLSFASLITLQKYRMGQIVPGEVWSTVVQNVFSREMLYFYRSKGLEMMPTISALDTLVVLKLPYFNAGLRQQLLPINVGDVVVLKDPIDAANLVVRRVVALEGHEMVSTNDEDEPFVLEQGQCWVLSDNKFLKPRDFNDSRTFGPISMSDIVGRVTYRFRTLKNNGFIINNRLSMDYDMPALYIELDIAEMQRFAENDEKTKVS